MSPTSKSEYFKSIYKRYQAASSSGKGRILDEFCQNCRYNRKYAIRKLNRGPLRRLKRKRRPGPRPQYDDPALKEALKAIWLTANLPCSKRLRVILPLWLPFYEAEFGALESKTLRKLARISAATIDRVLKPARILYRGKGRSATKPGLLLKSHIPIKTDQWDEKRPGFIEADTVMHCGASLAGEYAITLDTVDIATGWTELRAIYGKGETQVLDRLKDIEASLPFPILGYDCDNGSEVLNRPIWRHFVERRRPVQFTRSRAYHKDDNAHVEGKNWTHVRQWFGYRRFGDPEIVPLMNDLYRNEVRLFFNFFLPSMKLIEKRRIASRVVKIHDSPKTPYKRVLDSAFVEPKAKERLREIMKTLNPFTLKRTIDQKIARIMKLTW
jgi:hypothetical protein